MQTHDIKNKLITEISVAFSTGMPPQPDKDHISLLCSDDEGIAGYFVGRTWQGHATKALRNLECALNIFTTQAFAYYLPAYLIGDINEPDISDVLGDSLMFNLSPRHRSQKSEKIKALLSIEQKRLFSTILNMCIPKKGRRFLMKSI